MKYDLPIRGLKNNELANMHPWVAGFADLDAHDAKKRMQQRWEKIDRPSLRALSNTLLEFDVLYITDIDPGGSISAVRANTDESLIGNSWILPAPLESDEIRGKLEMIGLQDNKCLHDFLYYFGGLRECTENYGRFIYGETPWPVFTDSWEGSIECFEEWENSLMLFHAAEGSHILVRKDGKVGWWVYADFLVKTQADNLDDFILYFNEHRKIAYPFDPYGVQ